MRFTLNYLCLEETLPSSFTYDQVHPQASLSSALLPLGSHSPFLLQGKVLSHPLATVSTSGVDVNPALLAMESHLVSVTTDNHFCFLSLLVLFCLLGHSLTIQTKPGLPDRIREL